MLSFSNKYSPNNMIFSAISKKMIIESSSSMIKCFNQLILTKLVSKEFYIQYETLYKNMHVLLKRIICSFKKMVTRYLMTSKITVMNFSMVALPHLEVNKFLQQTGHLLHRINQLLTGFLLFLRLFFINFHQVF